MSAKWVSFSWVGLCFLGASASCGGAGGAAPAPAGPAGRSAPEAGAASTPSHGELVPTSAGQEPAEPPKNDSPRQTSESIQSAPPPGGEGGVVGGVVGRGPDDGAPPVPVDGVYTFSPKWMTRPALLSGGDPAYTKEAIAARAQGMVIARCTIQTDGSVADCSAIKSVPYMTDAVLAVLQGRRYTPVLLDGKPVNVRYTFPFKFVLPEPAP